MNILGKSNIDSMIKELSASALESKEKIIEFLKSIERDSGGISLSYAGRKEPWQIVRLVKPKVTKTIKSYSAGDPIAQAKNLLVEGENLSAMVTLYKYKGQVDLIITDPPYNADRDFRYNDKWDTNPDDPSLGDIVLKDDGSKHSKWLRFMAPRIFMMKEMLKQSGVIAICIDHRELYRLGILLDEIFGEANRIGIINWQKSYSPKSDSKHLSSATEYVLVYAKDIDKAETGMENRTEKMNSNYGNPDNDVLGDWFSDNMSATSGDPKSAYAIQSPFTGKFYYPKKYWRYAKKDIKKSLSEYGSEYCELDIGDNIFSYGKNKEPIRIKALALSGFDQKNEKSINDLIVEEARKKALSILESNGDGWPSIVFNLDGKGAPKWKRYLSQVKQGKVPFTFWATEDYETPINIGNVSWKYEESGANRHGKNELELIVGADHGFETVKPLKLIKKIIQLWCPPDGLILDPFAGSGTTAQAVLELNSDSNSSRRFILIEQGNTEKGDHYARTLTADRIKRTISGDWASGQRDPVYGGFSYIQIQKKKVDALAVVALAKEEMIDVLTTNYWNTADRSKSFLIPQSSQGHLFAKNFKNEGFFLVWQKEGPGILTRPIYSEIIKEAKMAGLEKRFHVYAIAAPYVAQNVEFYKIPDRVLEHLGFDSSHDETQDREAE